MEEGEGYTKEITFQKSHTDFHGGQSEQNRSVLFFQISDLCTTNVVYVTREDNFVYIHPLTPDALSQSNHEEADTRFFVHARHTTAEE